MLRTLVFFAWWRDLNARWSAWPRSWQWLLLLAAAFAGLVARLWASSFPFNFDFTVFDAVSREFLEGGNPYELGTWHYGPVWFMFLAAVRWILEGPSEFRLGLTIVLTLTDVLIAVMLSRRGYLAGAVLFLLVPIGMAISGQHGQFDNVSVALALAAGLLVTFTGTGGSLAWRDVAAVVLLGASLSTKHAFLVLPIWFAFRQRGWARRLIYALGPYAVLAGSLLPFWLADRDLITETVFRFRSVENAPAWYSLLPDEIVWGWVNRGFIVYIFLAVLLALGWYYRRIPAFEATLIYGITLVVFSPAIVDQYFAIPMPGIAAFLNLGFLAWIVFVSIYLLGEPEDFNLPIFNTLKLHLAPYQEGTYKDQFVFLFVGWLIMNLWLRREGWIRGDLRRSRSETRETREFSKPDGGIQ